MRSTVTTAARAHEVPDCDDVRPRMAKASVRVTHSHTALRSVIAQVVRNSPTKKEALAAELGKDRAQLYRQLDNGHLTVAELEVLGPEIGVELGRALLEMFGPLATPKARAKARIREARAILEELDQVVELIA